MYILINPHTASNSLQRKITSYQFLELPEQLQALYQEEEHARTDDDFDPIGETLAGSTALFDYLSDDDNDVRVAGQTEESEGFGGFDGGSFGGGGNGGSFDDTSDSNSSSSSDSYDSSDSGSSGGDD